MYGGYGLRPFLDEVGAILRAVAGYATGCGCVLPRATPPKTASSHFTSTLFVSPYQNHELLAETARAAAEEFGVSFLYRDFRPYFREGQDRARALGLYMQKYCGCIFSEEERYQKLKKPPKKEEA